MPIRLLYFPNPWLHSSYDPEALDTPSKQRPEQSLWEASGYSDRKERHLYVVPPLLGCSTRFCLSWPHFSMRSGIVVSRAMRFMPANIIANQLLPMPCHRDVPCGTFRK